VHIGVGLVKTGQVPHAGTAVGVIEIHQGRRIDTVFGAAGGQRIGADNEFHREGLVIHADLGQGTSFMAGPAEALAVGLAAAVFAE
jgi:hypothetical protein